MKTPELIKHLIPSSVLSTYGLYNYISNSFPESLNALLYKPLQKACLYNITAANSRELSMQAWLIILAHHQELNTAKLAAIAEQLHISNDDQTTFAYIFGRLDFATIERYTSYYEPALALYNYDLNKNSAYIFENAAANGHLHILEYLESKAPDKLQAMIAANNYDTFRAAAANGHLHILAYLESKDPDKLQAMIAEDNYAAFSAAVIYGHLHSLEYLESKAPKKLQAMIAGINYYAFRDAVKNGHLHILEYLESKAPDKLQAKIEARNYDAFRWAADNGHLHILEYLESKAPAKLQAMIEARNYDAFRWAADNGHLHILEYLESKAPAKLQAMIAADNYAAFRRAAASDHMHILVHLCDIASDSLTQMLSSNNFEALNSLRKKGTRAMAIFNRGLREPSIFACTEMHEREYGAYVNPFVADALTTLRAAHSAFERQQPNAVFDITDPEQAKLYFYMIRNLIRRGDNNVDDIRFLLGIPAVRALAHTVVNQGQENELLRLALSLERRDTATLLLSIPAISALAEQHNFYRREQRGDLDLQALARDRESSMTTLSSGEHKRLAAAISHYQPKIADAGGAPAVITQLRDTVIARYQANPSKITLDDGKELTLPLQYSEFLELSLTQPKLERALKAYYQNKDHSAWRYLEKPNPWMHANASYVEVNPNNLQERWSTFQEYQPVIAMYFLAAGDETIPPTDGHTIESRLEHFIDELAHIGRAHNWDKQDRPYEYDDLEGDRPSCYSGVKRRLFQSVLGHPLLKILTLDDIKQELSDFFKEHVKAQITPDNIESLNEAWDKLIIDGECEQILAGLDVTEEQKETFIQHLSTKYPSQFNIEPKFKEYINKRLQDKPQIIHFAGEIKFEDLLKPEPPKSIANSNSFFSTMRLSSSEPDSQNKDNVINGNPP
jgi:lipopolysaccharide biosynthesis glycosyltransferase